MTIRGWLGLAVLAGAVTGATLIAGQTAPSARTVVTLLDAGAATRQPLRYTAKAGDQVVRQFTMRMSLASSIDGVQMPLPPATPAMSFTITLRVVDVAANGDMTVAFDYSNASVVEEPGTPETMVASLRSSLAQMNGTRGRMVMNSRGGARDASIDVPPGTDAALRQQLQSVNESLGDIAPMVPEEAIGIGARWRTERQGTTQGIPVKSVSTYTLNAVNDGVFSIAVDVALMADQHDMPVPGLPPAVTAHLDALSASGSGRYAIGPADLMPRLADTSLTTEMRVTVRSPGPAQKMQQTLMMKVSLSEIRPPSR